MKINRRNNGSHTGKSGQEKEAYRQFITSKFELDKTENSPVDTNKTDESSFDEEDISNIPKTQRKSKWLKFKDFINNNWVVSIGGGIIVAIIIGLFTFLIKIEVSQKVHDEKFSNIEKNIDDIKKSDSDNLGGLTLLKQSFEIFKAETKKDLEFIKQKFKN